MLPSELIKASLATDEILGRMGLNKALNPLKYNDYLTIVGRLAKALEGATAKEEGNAMQAALNRLDVDWPKLNEEQIDRVIDAARGALRFRDEAYPELVGVLNTHGKRIITSTREAAKSRYGLRIPTDFNRIDANVLKSASTMQANFVRDAAGRRQDVFDQQARKIVSDGLEAGLGRVDISSALNDALGSVLGQTPSYYDVIASAHAGRARSYSHLSSLELGGVDEFEFIAVLDEVTSSVCRFMHGKRFQVRGSLQKYTSAASLDEPEDIKDHQPWLQVGTNDKGDQELYYKLSDGTRNVVAGVNDSGEGRRDDQGSFNSLMSDSELQSAGMSTPPLHGRCRSTIVAT